MCKKRPAADRSHCRSSPRPLLYFLLKNTIYTAVLSVFPALLFFDLTVRLPSVHPDSPA